MHIKLIVGTVGSNDNVFMDLDDDEFHGGLPKVQSAPQFQIGHNSSSDESGDDEVGMAKNDERVDKVYTVGCFDLFHRGHVNLLKNMRKLGKEVTIIILYLMLHMCECCVCNSYITGARDVWHLLHRSTRAINAMHPEHA